METMINVANLRPAFFAAIASGDKRTEWRRRKAIDPRLEAVRVGEPIVLLEIGSERAIYATVRARVRYEYPAYYVYAIRLLAPRLIAAPGVRKIQGWHRREHL